MSDESHAHYYGSTTLHGGINDEVLFYNMLMDEQNCFTMKVRFGYTRYSIAYEVNYPINGDELGPLIVQQDVNQLSPYLRKVKFLDLTKLYRRCDLGFSIPFPVDLAKAIESS